MESNLAERRLAPSLFGLPEYDEAFRSFVFEAINEIARANDPLLSQIRSERAETVGTSRVTGEKEVVDLPPVPIRVEFDFDHDEIVSGDMESLRRKLDAAAESHLRQLMPEF